MRPFKAITKAILFLAAGFVLPGLSGCGGSGPARIELGWPPAPREPMVVYEQTIYGSQNLERSFFGKIGDFLFGESQDMSLGKPYGVLFDGKDRLYIADTTKKGIMILDFGAGKVDFIESLGSYGRLGEPVNMVLDDQGNLYVSDTRLGRVVVFDPEGEFSHFIGENELTSPVGMALGPDGERLFVVDAARHEVRIFTTQGEPLGGFGGRGDNQGEFYHPLGIAISGGDTLYVVDSFHFAVQAFDLAGNFLFSFGSTADGIGSLARPRSIAIDGDGHLYVTDALKNNVQIFDPTGQLVLQFGMKGFRPGQFRLPAGICITEDNRIFVVDSINQRIQEFRYLPEGQGSDQS
ncbi:MAG: 6-bladed beta-propeller [Candidatus Krumholzibacteriota bacterium]